MVYERKWMLLNCLRPKEPVIYPKCDRKVFVDEVDEYLPERYRQIAKELKDKFSHQSNITVPVPKILEPDLAPITGPVKRRGNFSLFIPTHRQAAANLITMFMASKEAGELMALGSYIKDRSNPYLFQYAYQVALLHHPAAKGLPLPSVVEQFPEQFIDPVVFPLLTEENIVVDSNERVMIEIPRNYTASDLEDEQRLAYFREDIGVNMHHWHWHLVYPYEGPIEIVRKDRRGELFYYMHGQLVARYEAERLSNEMPRIVVYSNFREPIKEGYYSKLLRNTNMRPYPGRAPNTTLKDVNRPDEDVVVTLDDEEQVRSNILFAIDQGVAIAADGTRIPLNNDRGIDILGDIIEASILSVNPDLYGDFHNNAHNLIAFAHDPDGRYNESYGVMGDTSTAMRDPIFYRLHLHMDDIFQRHKRQLPTYTRRQLGYEPVAVSSVGVKIPRDNAAPNVLLTFWQRSQIDLSAGLDFAAPGRAFISFIHLQHAEFNYEINVNNNGTAPLTGTCRIFLAPVHDEYGRDYLFEEQRRLMIELDKFVVTRKFNYNVLLFVTLCNQVKKP